MRSFCHTVVVSLTADNVRKGVMELNLQQLLEQLQSCDESGRIVAKESKTMLGASAVETIRPKNATLSDIFAEGRT